MLQHLLNKWQLGQYPCNLVALSFKLTAKARRRIYIYISESELDQFFAVNLMVNQKHNALKQLMPIQLYTKATQMTTSLSIKMMYSILWSYSVNSSHRSSLLQSMEDLGILFQDVRFYGAAPAHLQILDMKMVFLQTRQGAFSAQCTEIQLLHSH